jgi:hypothetical protein
LSHLRVGYLITFVTLATLHISVVFKFGNLAKLALLATHLGHAAFYAASFVWMCYNVWDWAKWDRGCKVNVPAICGLIAVSNVVVGPGATMAGFSYLREKELSFKKN